MLKEIHDDHAALRRYLVDEGFLTREATSTGARAGPSSSEKTGSVERVAACDGGPMTVTVDAFQALARSSPWRWRTLHFRHRSGSEEVEAWLRRPGRLLVRTADGREHRVIGACRLLRPRLSPGTAMTGPRLRPRCDFELDDPLLEQLRLGRDARPGGAQPRRRRDEPARGPGRRPPRVAGRPAGAAGLRPALWWQLLRAALQRGRADGRLQQPRRGAGGLARADLPRPLRRRARRRDGRGRALPPDRWRAGRALARGRHPRGRRRPRRGVE